MAGFHRTENLLQKVSVDSLFENWKLNAATGLLQLVDESLQGSCLQGIALCRPPGHHAGPSSSTGFCLLNNVAVAARYAMHKYPGMMKAEFIVIFILGALCTVYIHVIQCCFVMPMHLVEHVVCKPVQVSNFGAASLDL